MKSFGIIIILLLTFSCSEKQTDLRIVEFEKELGKKETKSLNSLVSDFERNLRNIYPDLPIQKCYEKYLTDMTSELTTDWEKFEFQSDKTNSEFHQSGLWNEIYEVNYFQKPGSQDSIKSLNINRIGKYMRAIYAVKDSDSLLKKYWDKRDAAGLMQNELVINGILSSKPDFNDYFHKRIVVVAFSF